jgi:hypothetical protein
MALADGEANARAADRLVATDGAVFPAFDSLGCGITHVDALEFLSGAPSFQALPEDRRWLVAGMILGFAMVAVESDRMARE